MLLIISLYLSYQYYFDYIMLHVLLYIIYTIYNDTISGIITNTVSDYRMSFAVLEDFIKPLLQEFLF